MDLTNRWVTKRTAIIAAILLLAGGEVRAASGTWNVDANGNWTDANWTPGPYPDGIGQSASLTTNITADRVVTLNSSVNLGSLTIGDSGSTYFTYTLTNTAAETLTLDADGAGGGVWITKNVSTAKKDTITVPIILKGNLSVTNTSNSSGTELSLNGVISEAGGKRSVTARTGGTAGVITLNGANTYSGKTTLENGLLQFNSIKNVGGGASALGAPTNVVDGTITLGNGANACIFVYTGAGDTTDRILDLVGTTGTIQLRQSGSGKLTYTSSFASSSGGGAKTLQLYAGGVLVAEIQGVIADYGGVTTLTAVNANPSAGSSPGIWNLLGINTYTGPTTIESGAALLINTLGNVSGGASSLGAPTSVANGTITMGSGMDRRCRLKYIGTGHATDRVLQFNSAVASEKILTASGCGKLTFTAAACPVAYGATTNNINLTLDGAGEGEIQSVIADPIGKTTSINKGPSGGTPEPTTGTWTLSGTNTFTGTVTLNHSGRLIMGHANALGLGAGAIVMAAGTLDPGDADRTIANPVTLTAQTMAGTNNLTLTGKISSAQTAVYLTSSLDAGRLLTLGAIDITTSAGNRDFYLQGTGDTLITGVIDDGGTGTNRMHFINRGTTTLRANNAYALDTRLYGGGTLVLDYTSDESRLPDIPLYLAGPTAGYGGGDLMLKGGSYVEVVSNVTFEGVASGGGHYNIQRTSGSSVLRMDTILRTGTRYNTLNFSDDSIADTDTTNINGILAVSSIPFATVGGTDWAYNSTGGADGPIMKLPSGSYTALPASGGSNTVNYIQTGSATLSGTNTGFTLKLVSSGSGQSLDIGANNLNISGGLLYAGGGDGFYTITGSGTVMSGTTEANLYVNSGCTLTLDAPTVNANKALMKSGAGRLILNKASANSAALFVNEGAVRLRNDTAAGTTANGIFVCASPAGSALELAPDAGAGNPISVGAEALSLAGNGVSNGGALRNISGNNTYAGAVTIRLQGARINSDAGTLAITGGVVTASGQDVTFGGAGNVTVNTGAISSGGAVTKDGAGTLTLASSNTYTGPTTVNAGTLKVTGSIAAGSRVTVNSGATLSGSGTCYGEVWVRNGGTIKPEGGDLTVGSLILGNGATASVAAGGNKIVVSSTGALSDTLGLTICPGAQVALEGTHTAGTYDVFQYSGTIKGSVTNLALANPAGGRTYTFGTSGGVVRVTVAGGAGMLLMVK